MVKWVCILSDTFSGSTSQDAEQKYEELRQQVELLKTNSEKIAQELEEVKINNNNLAHELAHELEEAKKEVWLFSSPCLVYCTSPLVLFQFFIQAIYIFIVLRHGFFPQNLLLRPAKYFMSYPCCLSLFSQIIPCLIWCNFHFDRQINKLIFTTSTCLRMILTWSWPVNVQKSIVAAKPWTYMLSRLSSFFWFLLSVSIYMQSMTLTFMSTVDVKSICGRGHSCIKNVYQHNNACDAAESEDEHGYGYLCKLIWQVLQL